MLSFTVIVFIVLIFETSVTDWNQ